MDALPRLDADGPDVQEQRKTGTYDIAALSFGLSELAMCQGSSLVSDGTRQPPDADITEAKKNEENRLQRNAFALFGIG